MIAALKGLLSHALQERVNYVKRFHRAKERGIHVIETRDAEVRD